MSETCNSRRFSRLMKSCFPDNTTPDRSENLGSNKNALHAPPRAAASISSLPDDVLLECLSRLPNSSLPAASLACRRWSRLVDSPCFSDLRRGLGLLSESVYAFSAVDSGLFSASTRLGKDSAWKVSFFVPDDHGGACNLRGLLAHARLCAVGSRIYIVGRSGTVRYDTWTGAVTARSPMGFGRKKFAAAVVAGRIYVAGGAAGSVEEYDPEADAWRVVAHAPRRRYGCVGAGVDGVFYVIGGLRIGGGASGGAGAHAHAYAGSMDLYDVEARAWLRSRSVPGGGCVVAACAAAGRVYVLASHAVELSFWRFDARRKPRPPRAAVSGGSGGGFGEWARMKGPPLPGQTRLDGTVRFALVGVGDRAVLIQVVGCVDDLLRRGGRSARGVRDGLVLVYDTRAEEWSRGVDLPEVIRRAACVSVEC